MAQLAIKGHATRGKEVIQLLEMLGGVNYYGLEGTTNNCPYYIYNNKIHQWNEDANVENVIVFTLEEFEKKFPYKVGDKVTLDKSPCIITEMYWDYDDVIYYVSGDDFSKGVYSTDKDLQPYKEEIMEGVYAYNEINCYHQDFGDKVRIRLGNDFEIKVENNITYIVKKQPQYPKTYDECCNVLGIEDRENGYCGYEYELVPNKFDINTLVPFESKVLMRSSNAREWVGTIYSHYNNNKFYGCGMCCDQCIPYEGNEHLLGTNKDCDEFYKTWE